MSRWRLGLLASFGLLASCGGDEPVERAALASLPPGIAARAGGELVATATVARIAERQSIGSSEALVHALSDALLAEGARASLPRGTVASIERAAAARRILESLAAEASRQGPPTAAELEDIVRERWVDLDRPPAARTLHVVVRNTKPERDAAARALAEKLAEAVHSALSGEAFFAAAQAVPTDGFEVLTQELPFVTPDGRTFQRRESAFVATPSVFDKAFASAANALEVIGQQSPIVPSRFGFHIIRLEERAPAAGIPDSERAVALAPDVVAFRAGRARRELLDRLRKSSTVTLERAVDELTSRVQKAP